MASIPLLKLPILVIINIIQSMGFIDRFLLSHVSRKMRRIIKNQAKIRNHNFLIFFNQRVVIRFQTMERKTLPEDFIVEHKDTSDTNSFENLLQKPFNLSMSDTNRQLLTIFWDDIFIGMKTIYEEIIDLFSIPVDAISVNLNGVGGHLESITNFINTLDPKTGTVRIDGEQCDFQQYKYVLDNIKSSDILTCHAEPREYSEMGDISLIFKKVYIKFSQWMNLNHLKSIEANSIVIDNSNFTDEVINNLFRNLQRLLHLKTKLLEIIVYRHVDIDTIMDGLEADQVNESKWSFPMDNEEKFTVKFYGRDDPVVRRLVVRMEDSNAGNQGN